MVGATLGAIPAVIVALFQSPLQLGLVIGFVFLLQQLENNFLVPTIMGHQLEISALLTIVSLLIGAALMGIIGAMLAVPVAAVLQVIWLDVVVPWVKGNHAEPPEPGR
jgi:predicted PurR-regulated permease PerM